jgi:penicillin-binding protein 1A
MALGAGSVTPLQLAAAYGVFANGGHSVKPYLIEKVYDNQNRLLMQASPQRVGVNAPRVIDPRNAWLMTSMMQDVVRYGTAARAGQLGRGDIAGKTGTTNDSRDTWFAGYNPGLAAVAWMGYDQPRSLGRAETGSQAALPIWMSFMQTALKGVPQIGWVQPGGIISLTVDPASGLRVPEDTPGMTEHFMQEFPPREAESSDANAPANPDAAPTELAPAPPAPGIPL